MRVRSAGQRRALVMWGLLLSAPAGCGDDAEGGITTDETVSCEVAAAHYAYAVSEFAPGEGAGFGADSLPEVALGPPAATPTGVGSLHVVSLGVGGEITMEFSPAIVDGPGEDFIVYENAFVVAGSGEVFAEPAAVGVSSDGEEYTWFSCDLQTRKGCAGTTPTAPHEPCSLSLMTQLETGGDGFDLRDIGLPEARFVRIQDLSEAGVAPSAGFDLDAIRAVNVAEAGKFP